jgi:hypothetical protein
MENGALTPALAQMTPAALSVQVTVTTKTEKVQVVEAVDPKAGAAVGDNASTIAGAAVGGAVLFCLVVAAALYMRRRNNAGGDDDAERKRKQSAAEVDDSFSVDVVKGNHEDEDENAAAVL